MEYKGKKIRIGDTVTFATGLNDRGENNYSNGVVTSFSGDSKTMYVHLNRYGKTPKYTKVRHEEIFNVIKKERK